MSQQSWPRQEEIMSQQNSFMSRQCWLRKGNSCCDGILLCRDRVVQHRENYVATEYSYVTTENLKT